MEAGHEDSSPVSGWKGTLDPIRMRNFGEPWSWPEVGWLPSEIS